MMVLVPSIRSGKLLREIGHFWMHRDGLAEWLISQIENPHRPIEWSRSAISEGGDSPAEKTALPTTVYKR